MTTNRTSRGAAEFDRALTAPGGRVDPTMAALVAIAGALAATPQRSAPAFRDALRTKLMAEAASLAAAAPAASVPAASAPLRALPKVLARPAMQVATGGLATAIAMTGVTVGTSRSLPGDALYGLKRAIENLQVGLSGGATAEATALLEHVDTRLGEVRALLDRGDLDRVAGALEELDSELHSAVTRLVAAARDGSRLAYDTLQSGLSGVRAQVAALQSQVPVEARPALNSAMELLNVADAQLRVIVPPPVIVGPTPSRTTTPPPTTTPPTTTAPPTTAPPTTPPIVTTPPPTSILPTCLTLPLPLDCVPVTRPPLVTPTVPLPSVPVP